MSRGTETTFWDHVDALRRVLIMMLLTVAAAVVVLFAFMPRIFEQVILAPCHGSFPVYSLFGFNGDFSVSLINTELASQFFIHLSSTFQLAFLLTLPLLLMQLWSFVSPGLYVGERKLARTAFVAGMPMFYLGMAVGYFVVFPITLRFLANYQLSSEVVNTITLTSYMDNFTGILLVMGVMFEIPLVAWALGRIGLLNRSFFNRWRRHAIVALVVLAAIITPTSDPVSLAVVFLPLYLLWEFSALLVPRRKEIVSC